MKTDSIWYRLFLNFPGIFFELLGEPPTLANNYRFDSVEVKQTAFRIDGVFLPNSETSEQPIHFLEVQMQSDASFYSRFFSEIFIYLRQNQPPHDWRATVLFPSRRLEPELPQWYMEFSESDRLVRLYLDELEVPPESVGVGVVRLVVEPEGRAIELARELISRSQRAIHPPLRQEFIELIETVLVYKLPRKSREEIEAMLGLSELKQTRVYQEAKQEGRQEGREELRLELIPKLLNLGITPEEIARTLDLEVEVVRQVARQSEAGE